MMAEKSRFSMIQRVINFGKSPSQNKQLPSEGTQAVTATQTASTLPEGTEIPPEEKLYTEELNLASPPPQNVVTLHIYLVAQNKYCVRGSIGTKEIHIQPLHTTPLESPDLALGEMVQTDTNHRRFLMPENIRRRIDEFSSANSQIRYWLNKLYKSFDSDSLYLLIVDFTDFEIPWEMLRLSSKQEYLGTLMPIARWQTVIGEENNIFLNFEHQQCCGSSVLSYVLREDEKLECFKLEAEILKQKFNLEPYRNIQEFLEHLKQNDNSFGLIYIACHGEFGKEIEDIYIGSGKKNENKQNLWLADLRWKTLNLLQNSQSIVFINACHSGRLGAKSKGIPANYRQGFAELFLAKGARGVIGTLGAVGDNYAAQFAHDLIKESSGSHNLSVAALLRKLRLKVVEQLPEEPSTEDLLPFIYTFMYVYYGNPMTVLQLTPSGE